MILNKLNNQSIQITVGLSTAHLFLPAIVIKQCEMHVGK